MRAMRRFENKIINEKSFWLKNVPICNYDADTCEECTKTFKGSFGNDNPCMTYMPHSCPPNDCSHFFHISGIWRHHVSRGH